MILDLRRAVTWPLRPLGLEPGQALVNARPNPEQVRAARAELRAYIDARCAEDARRDPARGISRSM